MKFISGGFAVWQFSVASVQQSTVFVQLVVLPQIEYSQSMVLHCRRDSTAPYEWRLLTKPQKPYLYALLLHSNNNCGLTNSCSLDTISRNRKQAQNRTSVYAQGSSYNVTPVPLCCRQEGTLTYLQLEMACFLVHYTAASTMQAYSLGPQYQCLYIVNVHWGHNIPVLIQSMCTGATVYQCLQSMCTAWGGYNIAAYSISMQVMHSQIVKIKIHFYQLH